MADSDLRVPTLMVAFEAHKDAGRLTTTGPIGVTFPPQLPAEFESLVVVVIENPHPATATTEVHITIVGPDGATLADSVHHLRWTPIAHPAGPQFNSIIDSVRASYATPGAYEVKVFIGADPAPRAVTSFGVFLGP